MSIFGTTGVNYSEPLDIENMTFIESTLDNHFEAGVKVMAESEANFNNIMKSIAIYELNVLESTGSTVVYEAVDMSSMLRKFKEFFKNLWEKIKGIFKKFFALIDSMTMKDKDFVKKYKSQLNNVKTKDFEYKGYKFTIDAGKLVDPRTLGLESVSTVGSMDLGATEKFLKNYEDDKYDDFVDGYRGKLLGKENTKVESDEFHKELFELFRDGQSSTETFDSVDVHNLLKIIENSNESKKKAEKAMKDIKQPMDKLIKEYDNAEKEALNKTPGKADDNGEGHLYGEKAKVYAKVSSLYKDCMNAAQIYTTAKLQAIKDEKRQAKSVCVKLLTYKPKNEAAGFVHTEGGSFLDNVVIR